MPNQRSKVTVEDLLRLKRAERPGASFWTNFEHELRQKQLTALLEKRPWWQNLPHLLVRRSYIPLGATAVLAFTLISVRYYNPAPAASVGDTTANREAGLAVATSTSDPINTPLISPIGSVSAPVSVEDSVVAAVKSGRETMTSPNFPQQPVAPATESPSARSIAANLARLAQVEPELINSVSGGRLSSSLKVQSASVSLDELAVASTTATKRHRLLAQYSDRSISPEPVAPESVRYRLARSLADMDLNDRFGRVGLKADQVSLKF